jgi:hypothetical protein
MVSQRQLSKALSLAALVVAHRQELERSGVRLPAGRCLACAEWDEPVVIELDSARQVVPPRDCPGCGYRPLRLEIDRSVQGVAYTTVLSARDHGTPVTVRKTLIGIDPRELLHA